MKHMATADIMPEARRSSSGAELLRTLAIAGEAGRAMAPRMTDDQLAELRAQGVFFIALAEAERLGREYRLADVEASPAAAN